uniref:Uncharacterized protein n=1 Tax=Anguilla anguilla TaxID=7936 RepID=A0A0E9RDR7_ANGAN
MRIQIKLPSINQSPFLESSVVAYPAKAPILSSGSA